MLKLKREVIFKTPDELYAAELKAAMYAGGNFSKLVRNAIKEYSKEIPEYEKRNLFFDLNINGRLITVKVLNVPCKGNQENLILTARLETILEEKLKDQLDCPEEVIINFNDLIV